MLIKKCKIEQNVLKDNVILITGAGGGIGFEAARALCYLGANVIIAEINKEKGEKAQESINNELNDDRALFYHIDLAIEEQINDLVDFIINKYGFVDVLINNATYIAIGSVEEVDISKWDLSYQVNLKAPILLTQKLLPVMKKKNKGTIIFVPSSGAAPYMGCYEVFKTSQVELCNTIVMEEEKSNINVFSIGPGLVKTDTAHQAIIKISSMMGVSIDDFYKMNEKHILSVEEAGVGFALSVLKAKEYNGKEISSIQALIDFNLYEDEQNQTSDSKVIDWSVISNDLLEIVKTFNEQYEGWLKRNIFERQWVFRDFKKTVQDSVEQFKTRIDLLKTYVLENEYNQIVSYKSDLVKLKQYYEHQYKLLQGYEKNKVKLLEHSKILTSYINQLDKVINQL